MSTTGGPDWEDIEIQGREDFLEDLQGLIPKDHQWPELSSIRSLGMRMNSGTSLEQGLDNQAKMFSRTGFCEVHCIIS